MPLSYLDVAALKARTIMPDTDVDALDVMYPGWIASRLAVGTSEINSRLRKRYTVPFATPVPEVILGWLADLVTPVLYERRGWNPGDEQAKSITDAADRAREQMKEAAEAEGGLYDLPLRDDGDASAVSRGGPLAYAEASPYAWMDVQAEAIRGR